VSPASARQRAVIGQLEQLIGLKIILQQAT